MPIVSRTRLFPSHSPKPTHAPLSILDSTVVRFSPSAAVWIYETAPSVENLTTGLKATLNAYPQWAGQLQWAPYNPSGSHTQRYGRVELFYGTPADPGIEFIIASTSLELPSIASEVNKGCQDITDFPSTEFLDPETLLALHDAETYVGLPSLIVQITLFPAYGIAIAVKLAHPLADAQTLLQFTHDWAAITRAISIGEALPVLSPIFDPILLDSAAAGNIDAPNPSPTLLELSQSLPLNRFDCWASSTDCPAYFLPITQIPRQLNHAVEVAGTGIPASAGLSLGKPLPWKTWDGAAPVSHYLIEFSADELQVMWEEASSVNRTSHLDALLAHIWGCIIRARELDGEHHLAVSFGFRNRLSPPLPPSFLGSPLTLAKVTSNAQDALDYKLGHLASSIRRSLIAFDSSTLPAYLHELAFEASSLRMWNAFFGSRNTVVTSWLQLGLRDVDFGTGVPVNIEAVMPSVDGCVQFMETSSDVRRHDNILRAGNWYDRSATVSLHLKSDVMRRFLKDPALRRYRRQATNEG